MDTPKNKPIIISHLRQDEESGEWQFQSNEEHQKGVAELARQFGDTFGWGEHCFLMGLLHDKGKEQEAFQRYIRYRSGYDTSIVCREHPNHAYVGGLILNEIAPTQALLLARPVVSHHSGLKDRVEYSSTSIPLKKPYFAQTPAIPDLPSNTPHHVQDIHHLERMLFSCLVDADYLDTETFMQGHSRQSEMGSHSTMSELLDKMEKHLEQLTKASSPTPVNEIRNRIQQVCRESGDEPQGFYSLTVPTGGGKTLSGMLWALRHAVKHHLNRIIVAIPYTSIIVQTAQVLRSIFGENNVLEHHSAFDADELYSRQDDELDKDEFARHQRLASENWDYPIIVTTNVQLFQSMMASKPSRCRKLHNIVNSVIILDEAQMLPIEHLQPIVDSLKTYQRLFGCSVLLTTASQPVLAKEYLRGSKLDGLEKVTEIIPSTLQLYDQLRRVELHFDTTRHTYDEIACQLSSYDKVLCIVNTRKDALELFSRLPEGDGVYHLSRLMCSAHLADTLKQIRADLKNPEKKVVRVVATQLIEAGVDVDFPAVMRQEAGLDSILQAAGRCNREGKEALGHTYVFSLDKPLPMGFISHANSARLNMSNRSWDWFSPAAMNEYFRQLYSHADKFDVADIAHKLYDPLEIKFETAAQDFKLISENGISVVVNYGESIKWIERLKKEPISYGIKKNLAKFAVNLYEKDFKQLCKYGLIEEIIQGIYFISDPAQYDRKKGLSLENHWLEEILTI
jgi:CRISPR-associated endonuclease/helicase Cas3